MRLREALEESGTGALRRMASVHGLVHDDATTRDELVERVAERLLDPSYLEEQLGGLSEDERAVLVAARASGSDGELRGLLIERDHPGAAEALADRGLLFRIFSAAGPLRGEVFAAPEELLALLPIPPPVAGPPADEPMPAERRASDPTFSVFALVSALTRAGGNLQADVQPWSEEPGGWEWRGRWRFLQHLAESAGVLVHQADGALAPGARLAHLLNDPSALAERLWKAYLRERGMSELFSAGFEQGEALVEAVPLRQALIDAIEQLPEGAWISLDEFSAWLERTHPLVVREQLNARGLVLLEGSGWRELEHELLRYVLLGPLYWLGRISASPDGQHVMRRPAATASSPAPLEGGGGSGSGGGGSQLAVAHRTAPEACVWDGASELVASNRTALGTLLEAERYLVLLERGRPSRYRLVQSHVAGALGSGGSIGDCRRLLRQLTGSHLPQPVEERLAAWEQRFGAVSVRPAVLIEGRSAAELDEAIADERVRPFVRERLGPLVAEVAAADALELAAALRESGHLPRVDAALRLASEPRRAYAGLIDEQVLEFLLVSLLAFQRGRPEHLVELEGALTLLERLERQFPPERLRTLRAAAERLAGELTAGSVGPRPRRTSSVRGRGPTRRAGGRRG